MIRASWLRRGFAGTSPTPWLRLCESTALPISLEFAQFSIELMSVVVDATMHAIFYVQNFSSMTAAASRQHDNTGTNRTVTNGHPSGRTLDPPPRVDAQRPWMFCRSLLAINWYPIQYRCTDNRSRWISKCVLHLTDRVKRFDLFEHNTRE